MNLLEFQDNAVNGSNGLVETFKKLWNTGNKNLEITFKSPTGSGKTFMVSSFINELQRQPNFTEDIAFVWITFSDELAMQSRDKFNDYFYPNVSHQLLTVADFSQGILKKDDILFLNWQKLVSRKASDRVLRRPEDERLQKEEGFYFEDVVDATHAENRNVVMIIDESHKNVTEAAIRDVIGPLDPRIILKVSATPESVPGIDKVQNFEAGYVEVPRKDVIEAGLIKEQILPQTEDELNANSDEDLDYLLLDLAIEKRKKIETEWKRANQNINPLVLIQLPNDDSKSKDQGIETKEQVVMRHLKDHCGIPENKIACWFDNRKERLEHIADNDNSVEFMLFKQAAGTGWDCPRAHVIVMFREIENPQFKTQTLGRILRNPVPELNLADYPILRTGYLYTNYRKNQISDIDPIEENKPKTEVSKVSESHRVDFAIQQMSAALSKSMREAQATVNGNGAIKQEELQAIENTVKQVQDIFVPALKSAIISNPPTTVDTGNLHSEQATYSIAEDLFNGIKNSAGELEQSSEILEPIREKAINRVKEIVATAVPAPVANLVATKIAEQVGELMNSICGKIEPEFIVHPLLKSDFISRADYGDFGSAPAFQKSFCKSMNKYFDLSENTFGSPIAQEKRLKDKGIDTTPTLSDEIIAGGSIKGEKNSIEGSTDVKHEMAANETEKLFMNSCYQILDEQTEADAKYGNIKRSWSPFKMALNLWFKRHSMSWMDEVSCYKVFIKDIRKDASSIFRPAITQALKDYKPVRDEFVKERIKATEEQSATVFKVKTEYRYTSDYKDYQSALHSITQPFKLRENYNGRDNEIKFIAFLEQQECVEWWLKQADEGKDFYALRYFNTTEQKERLFYPDWIIKFKDGRIGIFDTKAGQTASNPEGRAEALAKKLRELNSLAGQDLFVGGLAVIENFQWFYNDSLNYQYKNNGNLSEGWKPLISIMH